jgi:hypothetical protein
MTYVNRIEPQDLVGADWETIKAAAVAAYWVVPINTDHPSFGRHFKLVEIAQSGKVHYAAR